jgi:hypothetical protein
VKGLGALTGSLLWDFQADSRLLAAPVIADGALLQARRLSGNRRGMEFPA